MPTTERRDLFFQGGGIAQTDFLTFDPDEKMTPEVEGIAKALVLGKKQEFVDSRAFPVDEQLESMGLKVKFIRPPFDPVEWSLIPEASTRLFRGIAAWARNTVGLGWSISARDFTGEPIDISKESNAVKVQYEKEREELIRLFSFPNINMPFTTVMELVKKDEEATGNGYLEVVRNNKGKIVSLYHVPAITVRVLEESKGFVQLRGMQFTSHPDSGDGVFTYTLPTSGKKSVRFFKNFGDSRVMNRKTGGIGTRTGSTNRSSEIIHFKLNSPRSSVYGVPRYVAAAPAIAGNRLAAERNVTFFENDAVPRAILSVTGGKLDSDSVDRIENFFKQKAQGTENAGRLLVVQVTPKQTGLNKESTTHIDFKPITVGVTEDASFLAYRGANEEEIREAMELSEVFYSVDLVNRSSGEISRQVTEQQSFEPDRIGKEFLINHTIVADHGWGLNEGEGPGIEIARLEFKRPKTLDPMDKAQVDSVYSAMGVKTVNEVRSDLGMDPLPSDFHFGDKPLVVALEEMKAGVSVTTGEDKTADKLKEQSTDLPERQMKLQEEAALEQQRAAKEAEKIALEQTKENAKALAGAAGAESKSKSEGDKKKKVTAKSRFSDGPYEIQNIANGILMKTLELRSNRKEQEVSNYEQDEKLKKKIKDEVSKELRNQIGRKK